MNKFSLKPFFFFPFVAIIVKKRYYLNASNKNTKKIDNKINEIRI